MEEPMSRSPKARRERGARSAWVVSVVAGLVLAVAPVAFVLLHRAPLPEEALVIAFAQLSAGDAAAGRRFVP
jgi:hypothetical protein